jgi:drug/metabolite transporter (DMT)-like permease
MTLTPVDIAIALSASISWALALIINKYLAASVGSLRMNTVRLWSGFSLVAALVWSLGVHEAAAPCSADQLALLALSGIVALAVGDTLFIRSLYYIYVSQAFPVGQCAFLVMTVLASILFLSEGYSWLNLCGGVLILAGLYLVSTYGRESGLMRLRSADRKGLLIAFVAALAWTGGAVILKFGLTQMNALSATAIRVLSAALALTVAQVGPWAPKPVGSPPRTGAVRLSWSALSGVLGYGIGGVAYVMAMQRVGAGRTVLITSLTPVLVLILSVLLLKERPTRSAVVGTVICAVGVICLSG